MHTDPTVRTERQRWLSKVDFRSGWETIPSPWMNEGGIRLGIALVGVVACGILLRLSLLNTLDLRDLPGAAGADTISHVLRSDFSTWSPWFIGLFLPLTEGSPVEAGHWIGMLSGLGMVLGAVLGGLALAGRAGALACGVVASAWSMAVMPVLLIGPDPPAIGLSWTGLGMVWASTRMHRLGWGLAALGTALVVLAIAVKPIALPALGLLIVGPLFLGPNRRTQGIQFAIIAGTGLLSWWLFSPDLNQHDGGLAPLGPSSLPGGIQDLFSMSSNWPDGALNLVLLGTLAMGLFPGKSWLRRLGTALLSAAVLALTANGLGTRICPRLLLVSAYGGIVACGVLMLLIGNRLGAQPWRRWVPTGLLGWVLLMDTWGWVVAWDQERARFTGSQLAEIPPAPEPWVGRYAVYAQQAHQERLRDITSSGATLLMSLTEGTTGVAIPPLRDRREQHLSVSAALSDVPLMVLAEHHCCEYPTTQGCAERVVAALSDSGVLLILPQEESQDGMVDPGSSWLSWLREAAEANGPLATDNPWWSLGVPKGQNGPLPCKPQYAQERHTQWPPPWPKGSSNRGQNHPN